MADTIKHYMWKEGESRNMPGGLDIEKRFQGMKYSQCDGLLDKGKRKNIQIESYADSNELRVWQGNVVLREATTITFSMYFIGDDRQAKYEAFTEYVSNGKIYYWDNKRKKQAYLVYSEALQPNEDVYKGSTPYILAEFKFKNMWGECKDMTF